jgi:Uncharacterized protein conserved in bacteria
MLVVDTSAIVAILLDEPDAMVLAHRLEQTTKRFLYTATYVELTAVLTRRFDPGYVDQIVETFLGEANLELTPVSVWQARLAKEAYTTYRILNYGDTFSYALAKDLNAPLLFKGQDFSRTDVVDALAKL